MPGHEGSSILTERQLTFGVPLGKSSSSEDRVVRFNLKEKEALLSKLVNSSSKSKAGEIVLSTKPTDIPSTMNLLTLIAKQSTKILFTFSDLLQAGQTNQSSSSHNFPADDNERSTPAVGSKQVDLQISPDAAHILLGTARAGASFSVIAPSAAVSTLAPAIYELVSLHAQCVFHISCFSTAVGEISADHSSVMQIRNSGAILLSSSNIQEAHDVAILASYIARELRHPVVHFFDGLSVGVQHSSLVRLSDLDLLGAEFLRPDNNSNNNNNGDVEGDLDEMTMVDSAPFSLRESDAAEVVEELIADASSTWLSGRSYKAVEYFGSPAATSVLLAVGTTGTAALISAVKSLRADGWPVGLIVVRVVRPWPLERLLRLLPNTVRTILTLEFGGKTSIGIRSSRPGPLFQDVSTSLRMGRRSTTIEHIAGTIAGRGPIFGLESAQHAFHFLLDGQAKKAHRIYTRDLELSPLSQCNSTSTSTSSFHSTFSSFSFSSSSSSSSSSSASAAAAGKRSRLEQRRQSAAHKRNDADAIKQYVVYMPADNSEQFADIENRFLAPGQHISTLNFFDSYSCLVPIAIKHIRIGGAVGMVNEVQNSHPIADGQADSVFILDTDRGSLLKLITVVKHLRKGAALVIFGSTKDNVVASLQGPVATELTEKDIKVLVFPSRDFDKVETLRLPMDLQIKTASSNSADSKQQPEDSSTVCLQQPASLSPFLLGPAAPSRLGSSSFFQLCTALVWPNSLQTTSQLVSPDEAENTLHLRVASIERLTPLSYDRNIFHIEFERLDGNPLHYSIGDALGIAPENDPVAVEQFLTWYTGGTQKKDLQRVVSVPAVGLRTVEQAFIQCLDLFGKPSTNFIRRLAELAEDEQQKATLTHLVSPAGVEDLRSRFAETQTYADLLREFPSAHPSVDELIAGLISPIKMRVYSIASSNKMHPNQVHLLVVVHDWTTPSGKHRVGTCTRYLDSLQAGSRVVAAFKPSAMILPPDHLQPVIMAGLGTGMAPFRAFIEERAFLSSQGVQVGPMMLYFGSRHRRMEYLYGDELEAYSAAGIISNLRLAFSRDQEEKVYIQHKLSQDASVIGQALTSQKAHFYLCGPTWPVPDVEKALDLALKTIDPNIDSQSVLQELKDHHRYVLEVY